ncbi:MAG: FtsK/SpoIIIE domain-containing protein [Ilumatobacteraceae bacterium]
MSSRVEHFTPDDHAAATAPPVSRTRRAPFDVALDGCRRVTVGDVGTETTVAEMVRSLCLGDLHRTRYGDDCTVAVLLVDGHPTAAAQRLIGTSIRHGSRLALAPVDTCPAVAPAVVEAVWVTGPDAGGALSLGAGSHVIGRSSTAVISCRDDTIELHHAVLDCDPSGPRWVTQLAGLQPIAIDFQSVGRSPDASVEDAATGAATDDAAPVAFGSRIQIGASVLELRRPAITEPRIGTMAGAKSGTSSDATNRAMTEPDRMGGAAMSGTGLNRPDPWRSPLVRSPRPIRVFDPSPVEVPRPARTATVFAGALTPALIGLVGAAAMAFVFGQVMFLMFGALGALVALGTWGAQKFGVVRGRKGAASEYATAVADFESALLAQQCEYESVWRGRVTTIAASLDVLRTRSPLLWSVRPSDPDAFVVSIGEGDLAWQPRLDGLGREVDASLWTSIERASRIGRMPISAGLGPSTVTAIVGVDNAFAVARSMVLQLAIASGPADWQLVVITDHPLRWEGLGWLPHIDDVGRVPLIGGTAECAELLSRLDGDPRHLVVVIDQPDLLSARTSILRRLLAGGRSVATVVVCPDEASVPAMATSVLILGRRTARWIADIRATALAEIVQIAGVSASATFDSAAAMARFTDPELGAEAAGLAREASLIELLEGTIGHDSDHFARRIASHWRAAGIDPRLSTPIGVAGDGTVEIDLVADGPHGLLAGTTGAGKSELLRSLVLGLATRCSPDHVSFVLVDYKGGSTFDACSLLPHVVGVVTDLDDRLAARALRSLEAELRRREHLLRDIGATDLAGYRAIVGERKPLPRLVVVIDEFATLAVQQPNFIGALLGIAQRGRSLGVHLLLATQRPNGVVNDDIRANTNLRVALRVQDRSDAVDVIGDPAAAQLPRSIPGRAMMRLGADEIVTFQTARSSGEHLGSTELDLLATAIAAAAVINQVEPPHRPWLPALGEDTGSSQPTESTNPPTAGEVVDNPVDTIGVLDDPDGQRRLPLRWVPADGHLALIGAAGSGTTTTLLALGAALARRAMPTELFVIDAMGDPRTSLLQSLSGCAAVVRVHETERLLRLIATLDREIASRKAAPVERRDRHEIVVMIDGISALRSELDGMDLYDAIEQLDAIITDGQPVAVTAVVTTATASSLPSAVLGQISNRWVFHLADPRDGSTVGVRAAMVPAAVPGRLIDSRSGLEGQVDPVDEQLLLDLACRPRSEPSAFASRDIRVLPDEVGAAALLAPERTAHDVLLSIGLSFDSLQPIGLAIALGEHVIVLGPSRSGRTTALTTIAESWRLAHPQGWIGSVATRRSSARIGEVFDDVAALLADSGWIAVTNDRAEQPTDQPMDRLADRQVDRRPDRLIVIDDAELVDDPSGALHQLVACRAEGVTVIAAGRPDSLRSTYGHWTAAVRRSRLGVVMSASADIDGDLLAISLPRRLPIPARPGLAWLVADGQRHLVQIARSTPA